LNNAEQQYNKREQLQQRGEGEVNGKDVRVDDDKQENRTTETTTDKGGKGQGSSTDISSSENSQQVKT